MTPSPRCWPKRFRNGARRRRRALLILSNEKALASSLEHYPAPVLDAVSAARQRLETAGVDWRTIGIENRYQAVAAIEPGGHDRTGAARRNLQRPA